MAYLYPCKNCIFEKVDCDKRTAMRVAFKGLGVTSAKFKCDNRTPLFSSGQRISFVWTVYDDCHEEDGAFDPDQTVFYGTVYGEAKSGLRFIVRVDQESEFYDYKPSEIFRNGGFAVKVKPSDMCVTDEPPQPMCETCMKYEGEQGLCHRNRDYQNPHGCLETSHVS